MPALLMLCSGTAQMMCVGLSSRLKLLPVWRPSKSVERGMFARSAAAGLVRSPFYLAYFRPKDELGVLGLCLDASAARGGPRIM